MSDIIKWSRMAWKKADLFLMRGAVSLFGFSALLIAYYIGRADASGWLLLVPAILAGFAIGAAEDRAESRAKTEWADRWIKMIADDHVMEVTVTHKREPTP